MIDSNKNRVICLFTPYLVEYSRDIHKNKKKCSTWNTFKIFYTV